MTRTEYNKVMSNHRRTADLPEIRIDTPGTPPSTTTAPEFLFPCEQRQGCVAEMPRHLPSVEERWRKVGADLRGAAARWGHGPRQCGGGEACGVWGMHALHSIGGSGFAKGVGGRRTVLILIPVPFSARTIPGPLTHTRTTNNKQPRIPLNQKISLSLYLYYQNQKPQHSP